MAGWFTPSYENGRLQALVSFRPFNQVYIARYAVYFTLFATDRRSEFAIVSLANFHSQDAVVSPDCLLTV